MQSMALEVIRTLLVIAAARIEQNRMVARAYQIRRRAPFQISRSRLHETGPQCSCSATSSGVTLVQKPAGLDRPIVLGDRVDGTLSKSGSSCCSTFRPKRCDLVASKAEARQHLVRMLAEHRGACRRRVPNLHLDRKLPAYVANADAATKPIVWGFADDETSKDV